MKTNTSIIVVIGLMTIIGLMFQGCEIENNNYAPVASFTVSPYSGTTQTVFVFDASASADVEDPTTQLLIRWDFNGDGVWDTDWIIDKSYGIQFIDESTYVAKLEVKDTQGATGQTTETIAVSNSGGGGGTITDTRDGQIYTTEVIGSQTWLSENLNYPATGSLCYEDDPANCEIYGRLYNWELALNICPTGWHLPNDNEWKQLEMYLGMSQSEVDDVDWRGTDEGKKMKATAGWWEDGNGSNISNFSGLPGGSQNAFDHYQGKTVESTWWSSTSFNIEGASGRRLSYDNDGVYRFESFFKTVSASVRCVKD